MYLLNDEYSQKAKREGYLARSVYKLIEINEKFSLFSSGNVLDIGAAPGSFSQYAYKKLKKGILVSVDINDIGLKYVNNFYFVKGDIFLEDTVSKINMFGPYSLVISDVAPRTTGNRLVDTSNSFNLSMRIIDLSLEVLLKKGNLLIKVFQGGDEMQIFKRFEKYFKFVKKIRPKAVRKNSFEIYFLGKSFGK
ncbi:RlmE family RNA methyltransferase [Borreliella valaisiana]|uniref:RlmE family RNA methyltransferase n=1 Tax=Borreliella valaisiana TaxID=62088 RepID=UPI002ED1D0B8|nr:RlmE family RNA methyltransferase [Borreliella valaisiana]WVN14048.1 RlmE family RNA methyltransferase [Borreliella valaisiana]